MIIPVYNAELFLNRSIKSALDQPETGEVILIDDRSTDGSLEICMRWKTIDPRVCVLSNTGVKGAAHARNLGIEKANFDWIQFLDADDELLPNKLKNDISFIEDNIAFIAGSWLLVIDGVETQTRIIQEEDLIIAIFDGRNCGNTVANLWHKGSIMKVGNFSNLPNAHDPDLMLKLTLNGFKYKISKSVLTKVHRIENHNHLSSSDLIGTFERHIFLRLNTIEELKRKDKLYFNKNKNYLYSATLGFLRYLYKYDKQRAINIYNEYFNKENIFFYSNFINNYYYIKLFQLTGFTFSTEIFENLHKLKSIIIKFKSNFFK